MIIDSIRKFIRTCPYLQEFNGAVKVNVDYLGDESTMYSIEETPCESIIKKYVDGSSIRQFEFIFCSRESYGPDVLNNISNSGFYEDFANWIEEENIKGNLPDLNDKECRTIECLTTGYAFQTDVDKARYQIQMRITYFQKGGRKNGN